MGKTIRTEILCKKNFLLGGQTSWLKEKLSSALVNLLGSWLLMKSLSTVIEQLCFKKALNMVTSRPKLEYCGCIMESCITEVEFVSILVCLGPSELLRIYLLGRVV